MAVKFKIDTRRQSQILKRDGKIKDGKNHSARLVGVKPK